MRPLFSLRNVSVALAVGGFTVMAWFLGSRGDFRTPISVEDKSGSAASSRESASPVPAPASVAPASGPVAAASGPAVAHPLPTILPRPQAGPASSRFFGWLQVYLGANAKERAAMLPEGARLARARRPELKALIASEPRTALSEAVPMTVRQQLPPEIAEELEERVNRRATLRVYQGTPAPGEPLPAETLTHRIAEFADGTAYVANVYGTRAESVRTIRNDSLNGIAVDNQMAVNDEPARVMEAGELPDPAKPVVASCPISGQEVVDSEAAREAVSADVTVLETPEQIVYLCGGYHKTTYYETYLYGEGGTGGPTATTGIQPAMPTPSLGSVKILVIPMTFADQNSIPATESKCYEVMRDVADFYAKSSYGRLTTQATVTPPIKLSHSEAWYVQTDTTNGGTLDGLGLEFTHAREEAKQLGFDWNNYDCTVLRLTGGPRATGGWGGAGQVWIYSDNVRIAAHEIGHSFGLMHANAWDTGGASAVGQGKNVEYGDLFDVMGTGAVPTDHFNVQAKNQIQWLPNDYIVEISQSGAYRLHAFDQAVLDPANHYGFKIVKDAQRTYWGEVRNLYSGNASQPWVDKGFILGWKFPTSGGANFQLIDTTPGSAYGRDDAAVSLGRTFSDRESGIHFTTVAVSETSPKYADVVVNFGAFPGNHPPNLSLTSSADVVPLNATVTFTAVAHDSDNDALAYSWQHFGDGSVRIVSPNSPTVTRTFTTAGIYVVTCTVSDMKGGQAIRSRVITVGNGGSRFTVSGRVTADGNGLANAVVNANGSSGSNAVVTDSDGYYVIPNLSSGTYSISAALAGYSFAAGFSNTVSVGPSYSGANFTAAELPLVTLAASIPVAGESGSSPGKFTLTRTGDVTSPLSVLLNPASGTAIKATDYSLSPGGVTGAQNLSTFTIPANQATLDILVDPLDDAIAEGPETVVLELVAGSNYRCPSLGAATVTIADDDSAMPKVSVLAGVGKALENSGQTLTAVFHRTGPSEEELVIAYTIGGTATAGSDYLPLSGSVVIAAGASSAAVTILPLDDSASEPLETVTLSLTAATSYIVDPTAAAASVSIVDDDVQVVSVTATDPSAGEVDLSLPGAKADVGTFLITRTGDTTAALAVYYSFGGGTSGTPALHGVDFDALPGVLTIPAGARSATVTITPRWDNLGEGPETVSLFLSSGFTSYQVSPTANSAVVTITDGLNPAYVEVIALAGAAEPSTSGVFRFSVKGGAGTGELTVNYTITGTATAGSDYQLAGLNTVTLSGSTTISLSSGTSVKEISVVPIDDGVGEDLENITLTITPSAAYSTFGPSSEATMWLRDANRPTVFVDPNVTSYPPSVAEGGGSGAFYLSRTGSTVDALTVFYTMDGTATPGVDYSAVSGMATIPAGSAGVSVAINPINDPTFEGTETIVLALSPGSYSRGPKSSLYLLDNDTGSRVIQFANTSAAGGESATTVNIPVTIASAPTSPVTVEYTVDSGSRLATLSTQSGIGPSMVVPYWVRAMRTGNVFRSYFSTDGLNWILIGAPQTIEIPTANCLAGLVVTGGTVGSSATATFDNVSVSGLDAGGSVGLRATAPLGAPTPAGGSSENSGTHTLTSGGPDLDTATTDGGRFVYFPISNSENCTITARVASLSSLTGRAGVMIRESEADNARHNAALATGNHQVRQTYRSAVGAPGISTPFIVVAKPWWLRLTRVGNVISCSSSPDGSIWASFMNTPVIPAGVPLLAGLAVSSKSDGQISTATFDNVTVSTNPVVAWQGQTVGFTDAQGRDSVEGGIYTVAGSGDGIGTGIFRADDECYFVGGPSTGDFTLTARVLTQEGGAAAAQAGLMVRESGSSRSRMAYFGVVADAGFEFISRATSVTDAYGAGIDYQLAPGTLTFNPGDTTRNIVLEVTNDSLVEPDENITIVLRNPVGAQLGTRSTFTYRIIDDDRNPSAVPALGFVALASTAPEQGGIASVPVSLSFPSSSAVTVSYVVAGGTATGGGDFATAAGSLTIPAGETVGFIPVSILDDDSVETAETILVSLENPVGASLSLAATHTLSIADDEFPVVSVASDSAAAREGGSMGIFTFTRVGSLSGSLVVSYTLGGSASNGSDYQAISSPGTIVIPSGSASATLNVIPMQDTMNEGDETVVLLLGASPSYSLGVLSTATVTIADDDRSTVSIVADDSDASEAPGNPGRFTVTRTAPTNGTLTVPLTVTGTATNGSDYTTISSVSFGAGQASRTIDVLPINDSLTEGTEYVTVQIGSGAYSIGNESFATVAITDNDSPPAVFIASPTSQGPLVTSGNGLMMTAQVTDDGFPQPISFGWSQVSGPGTATFATPSAFTSAVTFSANGTYVLRATAADGQFTVSDTMTVAVGTQIAPSDWMALDIATAGALRGQSMHIGGAYTLVGRGVGFTGSDSDSGYLMVRQVSGSSSVITRLTSVTGTPATPFAGVTIRDTLAASARRAVFGYVPGTGLQFRARTTAAQADTVVTQSAITLPVWLRLTRDATTGATTASYAPDIGGAPGAWIMVGTPTTIAMDSRSETGLALASNTSLTAMTTAIFDNLVVAPESTGPALFAEDFGFGAPTGSFVENEGSVTISAGGTLDIGGYFYGYQYSGDVMVTARLDDASSDAAGAKSGIMIRDGMNAGSAYAHFGRIGQSDLNGYVWRTSSSSTSTGGRTSFTSKLRWMRLLRQGSTITAFHAPDLGGVPGAWIQSGPPQTVLLGPSALIGLAVDNSGGTGLNTATFSNFSVVPVNRAPVVDAGSFAASVFSPVALVGTVTDDGFPSPALLSTQWISLDTPGAVSFDNATALATSAQFSVTGSYRFRLTASDGGATTFDDVSFSGIGGFAAWQDIWFPAGGGDASPDADPDRDGLANFLEYAFDTPPSAFTTMPVVADTVTIGSDKFLRMTVPKNPTATELRYEVRGTSDLTLPLSWSTSGLVVEVDSVATLQVRDTVPLGSAPTRSRFLRLFVTQPSGL